MNGPGDVWNQAAEKWSATIAQVGDDDWAKSTPCGEWTVQELVDHAMHWQGMGGSVFGAGTAPGQDWAEVQPALSAALAARGYKIKDPVIGYAAPVAPLLAHLPPPVTSFEVWPPLALQAETWAAGGIGPARLAVMERVGLEKTTLFGRLEDAPAGAAFVALSEGVGMIHAIEVAPAFRRKGLGRYLIAAAARWVKNRGGSHLSLIVTRANGPANALYSSLGMTPVGNYHYRIHPEGT